MTRLAQYLFAFAMIGLGILSLIHADFALQWQPVPANLSNRALWAQASGGLMLIGGVGLLIKPHLGALVLMLILLVWVVGLQVPAVIPQFTPKPEVVGALLPLFEDLAMICGAWLLCAAFARDSDGLPASHSLPLPYIMSGAGIGTARLLFAIACIVFGASHFIFADFTSKMVPAWMPQRLWLAYLTGAGHLAAGIAILTGVLSRLAAMLEALMMSSFLLLVHVPMVLAGSPPETQQLTWTMLCAAAGLSASAFAVAGSLSDRPWGFSKSGGLSKRR